MPLQDGVRPGFSPTFHLLKVLSDTITSSLSSVAKCANSATTTICNKPRQKTIHICIDIKDDLIILSLCNSKEGCARTIFVYKKPGEDSTKVAAEIILLIKRVRLNAHIEYGVCGGCNKILQAAENIKKIQTTPNSSVSLPVISLLPIKKQIAKEEDDMSFSKRFTKSVKMGPAMVEVYQHLLSMSAVSGVPTFSITGYRAKLLKNYEEEDYGRVDNQITALKKKGVIEKAGRGNIKVHRVKLEGSKSTTEEKHEDGQEVAKSADQTGESSVDNQRTELLKNHPISPTDNIVSHLLQSLVTAGNGKLDLENITEIIMKDCSLQGMILQARLKLLGQMIGNHPDCPQVTEDDEGRTVILFKI